MQTNTGIALLKLAVSENLARLRGLWQSLRILACYEVFGLSDDVVYFTTD